jgi:hypothetical protein
MLPTDRAAATPHAAAMYTRGRNDPDDTDPKFFVLCPYNARAHPRPLMCSPAAVGCSAMLASQQPKPSSRKPRRPTAERRGTSRNTHFPGGGGGATASDECQCAHFQPASPLRSTIELRDGCEIVLPSPIVAFASNSTVQ